MKISCFCGMVIGFLLAILIGGGIYCYFYMKEHPGSGEAGFDHVEAGWEKMKDGGDAVLHSVRPVVRKADQHYAPGSPIEQATGIEDKEK